MMLLLHGFTGSAATWAPFRERWPDAIAPDLLGHGDAACPADPHEYAVAREVERLVAGLPEYPVDVVGYSLGGRIALQLALSHPARVDRLVLVSASPGIADPVERAARVSSDEALAQMLEREGIDAFVRRWERLPLWASQSAPLRARLREERCRRSPIGLANSLRGVGQGVAPPVHSGLAGISSPTTLIFGALDVKYLELGQLLAESIPRSRLVVIPGAGHAVHLEQPELFASAVEEALAVRVA